MISEPTGVIGRIEDATLARARNHKIIVPFIFFPIFHRFSEKIFLKSSLKSFFKIVSTNIQKALFHFGFASKIP